MGGGTPGALRSPEGRLRLGWRLLSFVLLFAAASAPVALLLPPGILSTALATLVGGLLGGWMVLAFDGRGPAALGFHASPSALWESGAGLALGIALGLLVIATMAGLGGVRWTPQGGTAGQWTLRGAGALAFLAVPAAAEEALLRGYPLQALAEAWGPLPALGVTSAAFGALHLGNPGITLLGAVNVAVAGLFLGVIYLKTASLWWATGAHLGWNWSHGYLADVPVSGLELLDAPLYEGVARGPAWLGGGAFGPEGSAVATLLVLGAAALCWRSARLRPSPAALAAEPLATPRGGGRTAHALEPRGRGAGA